MTAPGFVAPKLLTFAAHEGEPELTFWRQTIGSIYGTIMHGSFPHVPMPASPSDWCGVELFIRSTAGEVYALGCTRLREHDGGHVAHDRPGYPVAGWVVRNPPISRSD